MNYFDWNLLYGNRTIATAWDSQVKEAERAPWLPGTLTECGDELFTRFAACYEELRALPRSARRTLQRHLARSSEIAGILPEYLQQGGRRLQHKMAWSLAGAALLLALEQGVVAAATITVTTNDASIVADGQCSIVEAIINANNDAATHPDCAAGNGADTIVLPANANVMLSAVYCSMYGQFCNPVGLPPITSRITIEGNGAVIVRQANAPEFHLMIVRYPGDVALRSVTLRGSLRSALYINTGRLAIKDSTISGNAGGGVSNDFGTLTIENSTISGNTAHFGAGVYNYGGPVTIENSTISGNRANVGGGGIYNGSSGFGGGTLTITNSTISGNSANSRGGGVLNSDTCQRFYCGGPAGILTLNNSLIAGNQAPVAPEIENTAMISAGNFNLFGFNGNAGVTGFTPGPTDIVSAVPLANILGPLQNNGGPTETHALVIGSPAINAVSAGGCTDSAGIPLTTDQRGFPRPFNGPACDIGSYEFQAMFCPSNSLQAAVDVASPGDVIPVSGICNENILVRNDKVRVSLDGGGTAVIHGSDPARPALDIRGKAIAIQNLTITGGSSGVEVNRGSNAVIDNNSIQNTGGSGVIVDELAFAVLTNNSIQNNPGAGVFVAENSAARIGFNSDTETVASPNAIQNNAVGVVVSNNSSARIIGNTISSNTGNGVVVLRNSQADLAANTIDNNGGDGIGVAENSFIQLGEDSGTGIFEAANSTTVNNAGVGARCTSGAAADGRLGSLKGIIGTTNFDGSCLNALSP